MLAIANRKQARLMLAAPFLALLWGGCPDADFSSEKSDSAQSALRMDAVTPNHGSTSGGTRVTIRGGPFQSDVGVLFGAHAGIDPVIVNDQMITTIAPPQLAGAVDVLVLANGGKVTVLGGYTYDGPEFLADSIEPASGPLEGGVQVTIRGTNIPSDAGVLFGATAATDVVFVNEQILTAVVPPAAEAGAVDVTLLDNSGQAVIAGTFEYVLEWPEVDDGTDTDGDGMTDVQETTGWEVWTEQFGLGLGVDTFGNVTRYVANSDPMNPDTDNDGINDKLEFLIRCDPRVTDTDGDGLWDGEEWNQWLTSPTSVDTDADARGDRNVQNAPNQALFDGMELFDPSALRLPPGHPLRVIKPRATSPTLFDTDGDGVADFDEFDSTVRNGVLADLPRLEYELVNDVDVRLNVEYAEAIGQTKEYGTTLTESQTDTVASSYSSTFGWSLEMGLEAGYAGSSVHALYNINAGIHGEYTWTSSTESSHESSRESSRLQSDSREMTETAADGAIRTSILLKNPGNTTFTLEGLGVLVSQREMRKAAGDTSPLTPAKTITTMTPAFDTVTLAPGETAGPFELAATGVNASAIKELLAHPDTLMLGTAAMNFQDQNGLDFDFVRQYTVAQTANIVIDFGDGEVRNYNVATNVDRNPDSSYRGITLRRALEEMLQLPYGDPIHGFTTRIEAGSGIQRLETLLGREYAERPVGTRRDFWALVASNPDLVNLDLNDAVLHAGDSLHLFYSRDDDDDGLSNTLEKAAGTDQDPVSTADADGDGLTDYFEVADGWIAFENAAAPEAPHPDGFEKRRVFSSPTAADSDDDGLSDGSEFGWRTDPLDPDSDGDSLLDGQDPFPNRRAGIRFVKADATAGGDGRTWATAFTTIQQALGAAAAGQATPAVPDDDVSQIWVARGVYKPTNQSTPLGLLNNVSIYGGFSGPGLGFAGETKRGQRLTNAFANGCIISGDLAGNDIGEIDLAAPGTRAENCPQIVVAPAGVNSSAVLDGFMLTGAYNPNSAATGGALATLGSPLIQNCLFFKNGNAGNGAGISVQDGSPVFKKCTLAENAAQFGGGVRVAFATYVVFEDCEFTQNEARLVSNPDAPTGGGIRIANGGRVDLTRCSFTGNKAHNKGAGVWADGAGTYVRIDSCRFYDNLITGTSGANWNGAGAGAFLDADASVSNSVFWGNHARNWGGGIAAFRRCTITNCTVAFNRSGAYGGGILTGTLFGHSGNVTIENTISWANWYGTEPLPDDPPYEESHNIVRADSALLSVRNSCFNAPLLYRGNNNIGEDPEVIGLELGDLRLNEESPCVDRGNSFVDLDPLLPGMQQLPELDFFGNLRIADGNGDGFVSVDMGACEGSATH